ncbi:MAG: GNAT family N-acetyltransferase [Gammaproteobacteria bacterium]|nr:GNAT family N-acetyltransferase [Gammaproteobacteria bacterium]MBU1725209.1 GNAT family N-acetyltransferase [Gammaproteobacteria bacterium]MBU2005660.1 GNAT family N-acetyltransferase [Gammaproteobacteria bacterium]
MKTLLLDKQHHDRANFDCGVDALNNYLKMMASQQSGKDNSRTFVLEDAEKTGVIIGYYTLTMTQADLGRLPARLQKKHQSNHSAGLIARLAVDRRYAGKGYGEFLLVDALVKLLQASEVVAFPFVLVDAKAGVARFYEKMGFTPFHDVPDSLFMTMADIRRTLNP